MAVKPCYAVVLEMFHGVLSVVTKVPKPQHESVEVPTFKGKAIIGKDLVPTEFQGQFAPLVEVALYSRTL